jgi:hypothetical protein
VVRALDSALAAHSLRTNQEEQTMFDGLDNSQYDEEVRERWGDTEAYRESTRRVAGYKPEDWRMIRSESEAVVRDFVALLRAGEPARGAGARAVAERHREHISRWFYPCSVQIHRGLGEMYVADERFTRTYEEEHQGAFALTPAPS